MEAGQSLPPEQILERRKNITPNVGAALSLVLLEAAEVQIILFILLVIEILIHPPGSRHVAAVVNVLPHLRRYIGMPYVAMQILCAACQTAAGVFSDVMLQRAKPLINIQAF